MWELLNLKMLLKIKQFSIQEENIDDLVIDLTSQNLDPKIKSQLNKYLDLNNNQGKA
ncbi:7428_t:CDS:2 [Dentiscutata erythropus]|uniref:7428_t:CDS:1 n=1 Tax=Dentiscutata erythropus TaxID=1348616 RepID=A0A9N8W7N9_9GLOM|nr:7428_t:CDS:2 [Dentiscutata erythropus]